MRIRGRARVDLKTKELVKRLGQGEIAIIDHPELDEVSATSLIQRGARAVINARRSMSGRYPNPGPMILLEAGIPILDDVGRAILERVRDGEQVTIEDDRVVVNGSEIGRGRWLTPESIRDQMRRTKANLRGELERFLGNTLEYAVKEKDYVLGDIPLPGVRTPINGRHCLIVVRGQNYREDLRTIKSYIDEVRPVLIGVDGGADALLEFGYRPHLVIGDMDSVSDQALTSGAELVVHAYRDGRAPGMNRIRGLGLEAVSFAAPGTSEDAAMLLAHDKGAELIVAVGTHSNIIDFLEKGRRGMASTMLVRMKVGPILVDARGVSKLYQGRIKAGHLIGLLGAALIPAAVIAAVARPTRQVLRLLLLKIRFLLGI